jgi:hypothetical protein
MTSQPSVKQLTSFATLGINITDSYTQGLLAEDTEEINALNGTANRNMYESVHSV